MNQPLRLKALILLGAVLLVLGIGLAHDFSSHEDHDHCTFCVSVGHGAPVPQGPFILPLEASVPWSPVPVFHGPSCLLETSKPSRAPPALLV